MDKVIDCLSYAMTAATLCCLVRYVIYPVLRLAFCIIAAVARFLARLLRQEPRDAALEHVAEMCASPLKLAPSRQQADHD